MRTQQKLPDVVCQAAARHAFESIEEFFGAASKHVQGKYDDAWVKSALRQYNEARSRGGFCAVKGLNDYILHLDRGRLGPSNCLAVRAA